MPMDNSAKVDALLGLTIAWNFLGHILQFSRSLFEDRWLHLMSMEYSDKVDALLGLTIARNFRRYISQYPEAYLKTNICI